VNAEVTLHNQDGGLVC